MSPASKSRHTWREKMDKVQEPRLVDTPPKWHKQFGPGKMLIATPSLVDSMMRKAPRGKLVTVRQIHERLAKDYCASSTCPLTTGIFVRIAAEVAEEDMQAGRKDATAYWRVVKNDGGLNEKFPGGVEGQARRLKREGHVIEPGKGRKPPRVKDFEQALTTL